MEKHINRDIAPKLSLQEAAERLRVHEDCMDEFAACFGSCLSAARPKYGFIGLDASVDGESACIGGARFSSRILRFHLQGRRRAYCSLVTCGRELYDFCNACEDILVRFWADGIAEMLMDQAAAALRSHIRQITGGRICAISPGSLGDFPITEQQKLFALLGDIPRSLGVELTDRCLMLPHKSVSAIYFESDEEYENCMLCLREGCSQRRAPFDERAFTERYKLTKDDVLLKPGI